MAVQYPHVTVKVYEDKPYPVVVHTFYGRTLKEAKSYLTAHIGIDEFLRDAIKQGSWKDIPLSVEIRTYG